MNRGKLSLVEMRTAQKGSIIQVRNVTDSKHMEFTNELLDYDYCRLFRTYFIRLQRLLFEVIDGDYTNVWGMVGIIPLDDKSITKELKLDKPKTLW